MFPSILEAGIWLVANCALSAPPLFAASYKYIKMDAALERHFQYVLVGRTEPSKRQRLRFSADGLMASKFTTAFGLKTRHP